jgi:hypothetical protein
MITLELTEKQLDELYDEMLSNTNEALPQTNESWLVLYGIGRAPLVPVW